MTWSHPTKDLHSRIDYIWISQSLIQQFIYCSLLRTTLYQSDHKMILLSLNKCQLFDAPLNIHYNQKQCYKTKFNYNKMSTNSWHNFTDLTDSLIHQHLTLCSMND